MSLRENIHLIHIKEPQYYERTNFIVCGHKLNYALTNTFSLNGYITTCDNKMSYLIGVKEYTPIAERCSNSFFKFIVTPPSSTPYHIKRFFANRYRLVIFYSPYFLLKNFTILSKIEPLIFKFESSFFLKQ